MARQTTRLRTQRPPPGPRISLSAADVSERFAGLIPLTLIAPEPRYAHRGAQLASSWYPALLENAVSMVYAVGRKQTSGICCHVRRSFIGRRQRTSHPLPCETGLARHGSGSLPEAHRRREPA